MAYRDPLRQGPPLWVMLIAAGLLVLGGCAVWEGFRTMMATGIQQVADARPTATTAPTSALATRDVQITLLPSLTPIPDCQAFIVTVPEAIIRACASTNCEIAGTANEGETVCVLERDYVQAEWYIIDLEPNALFVELAYMREDLIDPLNPTITPAPTLNLPTLTPPPTDTPLPTPPPSPTPDASLSPTPSPTFTPSPTAPLIQG